MLAGGHHVYNRFTSHWRSANPRLVSIVPFPPTDPEHNASCSAEGSRIPVYCPHCVVTFPQLRGGRFYNGSIVKGTAAVPSTYFLAMNDCTI